MASQPGLFGDPLTTRAVAALVKAEGVEALPSAQRRADHARYQEVVCRSALNRTKGMPFKWTLNPYRGCTHACHYCFARRYQTQLEMGIGDQFSSYIFVKRNIADVLAREVGKPSWSPELVAVGTATDPYQPIEGHYRLTRRCLEVLDASSTPVGLVTKGPMVVRDADILGRLSSRGLATVYVSVPTTDPVWERLEPGTAPPLQRLRAVRHLLDAGVRAGVLMSPLVPGFTTQPARIEATLQAMADLDVPLLGSNVLYLEGGTRDHFLGFLRAEAPHLLEKYARLYLGKYADKGYAAQVKSVVAALRASGNGEGTEMRECGNAGMAKAVGNAECGNAGMAKAVGDAECGNAGMAKAVGNAECGNAGMAKAVGNAECGNAGMAKAVGDAECGKLESPDVVEIQ